MESFAAFMGSGVSSLLGSRRNRGHWDPHAYVLDSNGCAPALALAPLSSFSPLSPLSPQWMGALYPSEYSAYQEPRYPKFPCRDGDGGCSSEVDLPLPYGYPPPYNEVVDNKPLRVVVDSESCTHDIPSKELRQVREDVGANMADRARRGRGAGDGVSASLTEMPLSGTQQVQHGPVSVSGPAYSNALYEQDFISMSAVPMVQSGRYRDPLTGAEYNTYESAMPPPDSDYEESVNAPGRNVKLAHIQGGWSDTTARPTKREVLEDDFNLQYDRSINSYGTYDASRLVERFERNNRFTRDDEHPDPEGPVLEGVPANQDGNQGNVKIRYLPYVAPTNRGKWAETTFRDSIDPSASLGNTAQMVAQTFTKWPCARAESTRQDGGGVQPTVNTQGFIDMQAGDGRRDIMNTQRSANEGRYRYSGPAGTAVNAEQLQDGVVEVPTGFSGLDAYDGVHGSHTTSTGSGGVAPHGHVDLPTGISGTRAFDGSGYGGLYTGEAQGGGVYGAPDVPRGTSGVSGYDGAGYGGGGGNGEAHGVVMFGELDAACGVSGLDAQGASYYGASGGQDGEQARALSVDVPTHTTGTSIVDAANFASSGGGGGVAGVGVGGVQSVPLHAEIAQLSNRSTGMSPIDAATVVGGVTVPSATAAGQMYPLHFDSHTSKAGVGAGGYGVGAGAGAGAGTGGEAGASVYPLHFDAQTSKSGVVSAGGYGFGAGAGAGAGTGAEAGSSVYPLHFDAQTSKTGLVLAGGYGFGAGAGSGALASVGGVHSQSAAQLSTTGQHLKSGVQTVGQFSHGSYGGVAAPHGQSALQVVVAATSKSGLSSSLGVPYGSGLVGGHGMSEVGTVVLADSYNARGKNKLEKLKSLYAAVQLQSSAAPSNVASVTTFNSKKGEENTVRVPCGSLYGSENSGYGMESRAVSTKLDSKREHKYVTAAISPVTDDSTRYLGHYNQTVETLNSRQFSNFSHPVASASMADFLQEREVCGL